MFISLIDHGIFSESDFIIAMENEGIWMRVILYTNNLKNAKIDNIITLTYTFDLAKLSSILK